MFVVYVHCMSMAGVCGVRVCVSVHMCSWYYVVPVHVYVVCVSVSGICVVFVG
jgi:hypothetical protein